MHGAWDRGDRRAALAAVPDAVIDELCIIGSAEECRRRIVEYCDAGITIPIIKFTNLETDPARRAAESLAMLRAAAPRD